MTTSKTTLASDPTAVCPSCGGHLHQRVSVDTCGDCGWVRCQGAD
ncbi:hypothetical protein [Haloarcula rubra]|nr:hypothetical protein [Halomicroarcula rubra]